MDLYDYELCVCVYVHSLRITLVSDVLRHICRSFRQSFQARQVRLRSDCGE